MPLDREGCTLHSCLPKETASPARRSLRAIRTRIVALACACACLAGVGSVLGCGPSKPAARPLGKYSGHVTSLFDDAIEPAAAGITGDRRLYQPKYDPLFLERAQTADAVLRIKVTTFVAKGEGKATSFVLGCKVESRLAGAHPPPEPFDLHVASDAPAAGILRNLDSSIVGKRYVVFVRAFVLTDGESELHFHIAPDTKDVVEAATDATTLVNAAAAR